MAFRDYKAQDFKDAIRRAEGIVAGAARLMGCSRTTIYKAVKKYPTVEEVLDEERASKVDEAEGRLLKIMRMDGHKDQMKAIRMVLRTQGGKRWQETQRIEHAGEGGGPVRVMYDRNTPEPDE